MLEIVYASAAAAAFTEEQLQAVLVQARVNNDSLGVTGMLVYDRGTFLQVIEGPAAPTRGLFEKISKDVRHHRIVRISEGEVKTRSFEGWSMGFVSLERTRRLQASGGSSLFASDFSFASLLSAPGYRNARAFLLALRDDRFRVHVAA
jgi:hypothetical protein